MSAEGTISGTAQELARIFTVAALNHGNMTKAHDELKELGVRVPSIYTLNRWRRDNRELYEQIQTDIWEGLRKQEAAAHLAVAAETRDLVPESVKQIRDALAEGKIDARDLGGLARNLATVSAIHTDKALALAGEGQAGISININMPDQVRAMAAEGAKFYDDTGKEITVEQATEIASRKALPQKTGDGRPDRDNATTGNGVE